jgi:hypothetical protein
VNHKTTGLTGLHSSEHIGMWLACVSPVLAAVMLSLLIRFIQTKAPDQSESAVLWTAAVLGFLALLGCLVVAIRWRFQPACAAAGALAVIATCLLGIYLFHVSSAVFFPADFLIWSESDFVNDILKVRTGYPLYTADVNNDSFTYPFGTQILTLLLAALAGQPDSVAAYRVVQVLFTAGSAFVAILCCRRIISMAAPQIRIEPLWLALWAPALFLIATNPVTNGYTHNLHNDALSQLVTLAAFYLLLRYAEAPSRGVLVLMAVLPAAGFLIKQSLVVWAGFFAAYLLVFDKPLSVRRVLVFSASAAALTGLLLALCLAVWGYPFYYWVLFVLGKHGVSPLRSFQHLLDIWPFLVAGLFGGLVLFRREPRTRLFGVWLVWLVLILLQTWTSGIAWMLNHIGPGCLIAGVWFLAALVVLWENFQPAGVLEPALVASMVLLLFAGMGLVRIPLPAIPADGARYVADIEKHFASGAPDRVLLDAGTWLYFPHRIVMKDRAPSIGERGWSQTGDFSGMLGRIRSRHYDRILVRNYGSGDFWYDHATWLESSGIRAAMAENYEIAATIAGVTGTGGSELSYLFSPVTVLKARTVPNAVSSAPEKANEMPRRTAVNRAAVEGVGH